jgi:soluble lytic murein transglycosylase-like protein
MKRAHHDKRRSHPWRGAVGLLAAALLLPSALASTPQQPDPRLRALLKEAVADTASFPDRFDAQVWLLDMAGRLEPWVEDPEERLAILKAVHQEATRADLDPELVLAVIHVESLFDRFAISRVGARGLMQVMPFWLDEIGRPRDNLFHIRTNLRMGCTILRYYLDMEDGRLTPALARYNGSYGRNTYPLKVFRALERYWFAQ